MTDRLKILVVSAQFPFPPRFGFATRVYQLARQLAIRHDVTLLSYARPDERDHTAALAHELRVRTVERDPGSVRMKRASQFASVCSPEPFSCRAVRSERMQRAITTLCTREQFDVIQLESSLLCAFAFPPGARLVLDEHNIEYEVFQRMCEGERSLARRAFNRVEHLRFRRFEQRWWSRVNGCVVTSEREVPIIQSHAPLTPVAAVPNGVDLDYFRPESNSPDPHTLVFNGILTYRPNLDAAYHLVEDIWPEVLRRCPDAKLTVVGRGKSADLRRLSRPGVVIAGEVPDIRPYLSAAAVVGVPIRIGGGTRLKVVEGLAMGKAMVSTSLGCEGVAVRDGEHLLVADDPQSFARRVVDLFDTPAVGVMLGRAGRALIEREYSWELAGERLHMLYRRVVPRSHGSGALPVSLATPASAAGGVAP
ncbi:MAG: glycosyltransferase [Chloroflexi bacterium]|nr:glycosyltransferase [Chloroflexota bacterium]